MRRRYIFFVLLMLILIAGVFYFYGGSRVPSGQPALESLTAQTLPTFESAFNGAKDDVRVLLLLSPT